MTATLSPYRLRKARRLYNIFTAFNAFSFAFLSGNIITLYALRLGATSTAIGVLNAFTFVSFFFMPIGKRLVARLRIIDVFGVAWLLRYVFMVPLLFAPLAAAAGRLELAIGLMMAAVFSFHLFRGIGMIGNNPILNQLASGPDRGSYMVQLQILNSAIAMLASLSLALLLGRNPPLVLYAVIVGVGIVVGVAGCLLVFKIPEPAQHPQKRKQHLMATFGRSLASAPFRYFVAVFFCVSFVSATARAFSVVYTRDVYLQGDGSVALYAVVGGLGSLAIGLFTRLLVDRLGAKPLYIVYTAVAALSLVPTLLSPGLGHPILGALFLSLFHFSLNFGFIGAEGIAQNYFFGLVDPEDLLDLGILYYFVYGAAGAAGSFFGGIALDLLYSAGLNPASAYRFFFSALILILLCALGLQGRLVRLGAMPLKGALGIIFSFKDLRAMSLLNRLGTIHSPREETELLEALHDSPSTVGASGLLERVRSPRLSVRQESLRALEALPAFTDEVEAALIADAEQNQYTTAYIAARALGLHGSLRALPLLRKTMHSDDYMLAGESMVALARIGDEKSVSSIGDLLSRTRNPRLLIMGAYALELFGDSSSLPALLDLFRREAPPPYVRDEVILSLSGILGFLDRFYPEYVRFLEDPDLGPTLVLDQLDSALERHSAALRRRGNLALGVAALRAALVDLLEAGNGAGFSRWVHIHKAGGTCLVDELLSEAALDGDLSSDVRFRFLLCFWAIHVQEAELCD